MSTKELTFNRERFATASLIYRNENELTVEKFAERMGVSSYVINAYELKRSGPTLHTAINFCRITGNDFYSFIDEGSKKNPQCSLTDINKIDTGCDFNFKPETIKLEMKEEKGKYFVRINGGGDWIAADWNKGESTVRIHY